MLRSLCVGFAVLFATAALPTPAARAAYAPAYSAYAPDSINDGRVHHRDTDLSLMLWLPWYYGFGVGGEGRLEFPVLPDGFVPNLNDEFSLEPSFGIAYSSYGGYAAQNLSFTDITPALYGIWSFWFSQQLRLYVGLGLGVNIGIYSGPYSGYLNATYFYWDPCVGVNFKLTPTFGLRAEAGAQGLKGGIFFAF